MSAAEHAQELAHLKTLSAHLRRVKPEQREAALEKEIQASLFPDTLDAVLRRVRARMKAFACDPLLACEAEIRLLERERDPA